MSTPEPKTETTPNPWQEYERRKRDLPEDLTSEQHDLELRKIADELGL